MTNPYQYRIVGCLDGHEPIELHRSQKKYCPKLWDAVTRDLSMAWSVWMERPMDDRETLTPRPRVRNPWVSSVAAKLRVYQ